MSYNYTLGTKFNCAVELHWALCLRRRGQLTLPTSWSGMFCSGCFGREDESPAKLALYWFKRGVQSCSGIKLHREVKFAVLRQRWQNVALAAEVVDDSAMGSLAFKFCNWSALRGKGRDSKVVSGMFFLSLRWCGRLLPSFEDHPDHSCFQSGCPACSWCRKFVTSTSRIASSLMTSVTRKIMNCSTLLRAAVLASALSVWSM